MNTGSNDGRSECRNEGRNEARSEAINEAINEAVNGAVNETVNYQRVLFAPLFRHHSVTLPSVVGINVGINVGVKTWYLGGACELYFCYQVRKNDNRNEYRKLCLVFVSCVQKSIGLKLRNLSDWNPKISRVRLP